MTKLKALLLIPVLLAATGCEVLYDIQQNETADACNKLVGFQERNECLKRNQTSYQQYERERQNLKLGRSEKTAAPGSK